MVCIRKLEGKTSWIFLSFFLVCLFGVFWFVGFGVFFVHGVFLEVSIAVV